MKDKLKLQYDLDEQGYVDIYFELAPYIDAFANKKTAPDKYNRLRSELCEIVSRGNADNYWDDILRCVSEELPPSIMGAIERAPAVEIMGEHFAEILMNAIDETIQANHADKRNPTCMNMTIKIDAQSLPGLVSLYVFDNGRGYPQKFLQQINTEEGRNNYMLTQQNTTNLKKRDAHLNTSRAYDGPDLVGGRGLGLRMFLADAQNDQLVGLGPNKKLTNIYPKSEDYYLHFGNLQENSPSCRGGVIHLRTPLTPRKSFSELMIDEGDRNVEADTLSPDIISSGVSSLSIDVGSDYEDEDEEGYNKKFSPR